MATKKPTPKGAKTATKVHVKPAPTGLAAFFDASLFLPDLKAHNKVEVFEEMVEVLGGSLGKQHKQQLLSMLHHREMLGTTGIGRGVAIPHGRTLLTRTLRVAFGRSRAGIDYGTRDGEPVHLMFLVVAPFQDRGNVYLPTLGKLVEIVRSKENRDKLMTVASFDELVETLSGVVGLMGDEVLEETLQILLELQHIDQRLAEFDKPDHQEEYYEKLGFHWDLERRQQLLELRTKRAAQLEAEVLTHYEGLRDRYGEAIVPIDGGICLGCFMMIPTAWVQNIRQNLSVRTCGHCGRILYWVG